MFSQQIFSKFDFYVNLWYNYCITGLTKALHRRIYKYDSANNCKIYLLEQADKNARDRIFIKRVPGQRDTIVL